VKVFSEKDAADILRYGSPSLYGLVRAGVETGTSRRRIARAVQRQLDRRSGVVGVRYSRTIAGQLLCGLAERTTEYFLAMARQIDQIDSAGAR